MDPRHELWRRLAAGTDEGIGLSWMLHDVQREAREQMRIAAMVDIAHRVMTFRWSRRLGKSRGMSVDAFENGVRKKPRPWLMKYAAPTQADAEEIIEEHTEPILATMPRDLRPRWRMGKSRYEFVDGSILKLVGCDDRRKMNRLRGKSMHRGYVDEGRDIPEVGYLMRRILQPQTRTVRLPDDPTAGWIIYGSTPADTPAHESKSIFTMAEAAGVGFHKTIYDAPHIPDSERVIAMIESVPGLDVALAWEYVRSRSGPDDAGWRIEYMAEHCVDTVRAVLPEFSQHFSKIVVEPPPKPEIYHTYVGADLGWHDLTAVLLAYFDFDIGKLVVEDEVVLSKATSNVIVEHVSAKERALWGTRRVPVDHPKGAPKWEPVTRVADAPEIVIADLRRLHGESWRVTRKDDADAALNALRIALAAGRIIIHPRCTQTIAHCEGAIWNPRRTDYERSDAFGHFDAVDALVYLWRCVDTNANPYPAGYHERHIPRDSLFRRKALEDRAQEAQLLKLVRR